VAGKEGKPIYGIERIVDGTTFSRPASTEKEANDGGEKGEEVDQKEGQVAALRLPQRNGE
jgi:hypothetical protein